MELKNLNKIAIITNFLAFFLFLIEQFSLPDPEPHTECGSGRENECGSVSTAMGPAIFKC